jgi:hypothetical protein
MMMMFTRQTQYIQMLLDMPKSRDVIQEDDIPAFDSAVINDPDSVAALLRVKGQYDSFANRLGMALPDLPNTPR